MSVVDPWLDHLRARLRAPLPGRAAQYRMAHVRRVEDLQRLPAPPPDARVACVLNLLHRHDDGVWRTVLIRRTVNPRDQHSGQVSFPGGRWEEADGALVNVALREAEEEVGVPADAVEIIGRLTELYIPVSHFLVHPFVGVLREPVDFRPQAGEVEIILTPSLALLSAPESRKIIDIPVGRGLTLRNTPYFDVEGHVVWGATAMILSEFLEVAFAAEENVSCC
ncbi:MAG: CoA pyrophosphatase [Saprospiraceae bacterium]|nr:CoA pyrophosphatase [Saprospiraceae bacterium]MDW8229765.1 CoA pyrophosphatase [Saprospiraceae bacterium]